MFPLKADDPYINKDGSRTTLGNVTGDISDIRDDIDDVADSITPISQTGTKATTAITAGTYFYLGSDLVKAKTNIAIGDTFTSGTNYTAIAAGGYNDLSDDINALDGRLDIIEAGYIPTSKITVFAYTYDEVTIAANSDSGSLSPTNTLPTGAIVLGLYSLYSGNNHNCVPYRMNIENGTVGVRNMGDNSVTVTPGMGIIIYNPSLT